MEIALFCEKNQEFGTPTPPLPPLSYGPESFASNGNYTQQGFQWYTLAGATKGATGRQVG